MSIPGAASPLFIGAAAGAAAGYQIDRSLRFNSADSAYLNRTPSSAGNRKTWTLSFWVKLCGTSGHLISAGNDAFQIEMRSDGQYLIANSGCFSNTYSTAVFRDYSAWQHFVIEHDATNTYCKIYVNGSLQNTITASNADGAFNNNTAHNFNGRSTSLDSFTDFYLAEVNFIDGQALDPTSFGAFDDNGVWQAIDTAGLTFGTNGFRLKFADNSSNAALGTDSSGNSNTWSVNNLITSVSAQGVAFDGNDSLTFAGPGSVTGDFTIECFVNADYSGGYKRIVGANEASQGSEYTTIRSNGGNIYYIFGDSSGYVSYNGSTIPTGQFSHVAITRSGSTVSYYLNGSRLSTSSLSSTFSMTGLVLAHGYGSEYTTGTISNARVVNGQALYTGSSYTVPTGPLTTTSQGATASNVINLVANTSTVTANGGTGSAGTAGGDPTAVSASVFGKASDIDSLVDTPTNAATPSDSGIGGEVVGNYCTWNPLNKPSAITLSNGNLDCQLGSSDAVQLSTIGMSSGKWYAEITGVSTTGGFYNAIGLGKEGAGGYLGSNAQGWGYHQDGRKIAGGGAASYGASYAQGDVIGVAFDADNGTLTFYKNGSSQGTAYTGLTSGPYFFAVGSSQTKNVANFGQRAFAYQNAGTNRPSADYKSLNTANLPDPTIADGSTAFDAKAFTANNGSQSISLGFAPDLVWTKSRANAYEGQIFDIVRGNNQEMSPNATRADRTLANSLTFDSSGFTMPSNNNNANYGSGGSIAWAWDAGTSTVSNSDGSITSNVRANPSAGFSIVSYSSASNSVTVGHGLNAAPEFIILKDRNNSYDWVVITTLLANTTDYLVLNSTAASANFGVDAPTSTTFIPSQSANSNYIAYCFAPVEGFSAFGGPYSGTGSASTAAFQYCGFKPKLLMIKRTDSTTSGNWIMLDSARSPHNVVNDPLYANSNAAEYADKHDIVDFLSNGFRIRAAGNDGNNSGGSFIWAAWAESPFKTSRAH